MTRYTDEVVAVLGEPLLPTDAHLNEHMDYNVLREMLVRDAVAGVLDLKPAFAALLCTELGADEIECGLTHNSTPTEEIMILWASTEAWFKNASAVARWEEELVIYKPDDAVAAIVVERETSNPNSAFTATHPQGFTVVGWSNKTRKGIPELKRAAATYGPTTHFVEATEGSAYTKGRPVVYRDDFKGPVIIENTTAEDGSSIKTTLRKMELRFLPPHLTTMGDLLLGVEAC